MLELLQEQKRTNRLLQWLGALATGFALGLVLVQFLLRVRPF
jgi:hypothetical protein